MTKMRDNYQNTMYACFVGYIVQAIINNFVPLLFLTFEKSYGIPLNQITMLITFNFGIQLVICCQPSLWIKSAIGFPLFLPIFFRQQVLSVW